MMTLIKVAIFKSFAVAGTANYFAQNYARPAPSVLIITNLIGSTRAKPRAMLCSCITNKY